MTCALCHAFESALLIHFYLKGEESILIDTNDLPIVHFAFDSGVKLVRAYAPRRRNMHPALIQANVEFAREERAKAATLRATNE